MNQDEPTEITEKNTVGEVSNIAPESTHAGDINTTSNTNVTPSDKHADHDCGCMNNQEYNSMQRSYIYAIGRIRPVFRSLAVEKEYAQVLGKSDTSGLTDMQALKEVLLKKENRYLLRQICWVLNIEGLDAYVLQPLDLDDLEYFINAFHPPHEPSDVNVVIGVKGSNCDPHLCGGLSLPIAIVTNIYSFDVDFLIKNIPKPQRQDEKKFRETSKEIFYRIIQLADNFGTMDVHRAVNYLAVRYSAIYAKSAEMFLDGNSLSAVEVVPSRLSLSRKIVDVIFTYVDRKSDVISKFFVRVDVTEEFPFLVTKLSPYFDR